MTGIQFVVRSFCHQLAQQVSIILFKSISLGDLTKKVWLAKIFSPQEKLIISFSSTCVCGSPRSVPNLGTLLLEEGEKTNLYSSGTSALSFTSWGSEGTHSYTSKHMVPREDAGEEEVMVVVVEEGKGVVEKMKGLRVGPSV